MKSEMLQNRANVSNLPLAFRVVEVREFPGIAVGDDGRRRGGALMHPLKAVQQNVPWHPRGSVFL
jgi:hypothetical protein